MPNEIKLKLIDHQSSPPFFIEHLLSALQQKCQY